MSNLRALIQQIEKGGLQLSGVRPTVVTRNLSYLELSNAIDACILDIHKWYPELFVASNYVNIYPALLKMYLFTHAMWFIYKNGSLSFYTGGPTPPSCYGFYLPRGFMKWLAGLGLYEEGGAQGVTAFNISAMPALSTSRALTSGTPVITNLQLSSYNISSYVMSQTYGEMLKDTGTITAIDFASFWNTYGADISTKLQDSGYPCVAHPEAKVSAPDGSAWAHPYNLVPVGVALSAANALTCVFSKWHAEVAMLYLDWSTTYAIQPSSNVRPVPRPPAEYGFTNTGTLIVADSARVLRENFFFLARSTADGWDKPILPIDWMGEEVQTLGIVPVPIHRHNRWILWMRVMQALAGTSPGSSYASDNNWKFASYFVSLMADVRRIQANNPRYEIRLNRTTTDISSNDMPMARAIESFRLPLLEAQVSSEIGCVIHNGQLHAPFMETLGCPWYEFWFGGGTGLSVNYWNMITNLWNGSGGPLISTATFPIASNSSTGAIILADGTWFSGYNGSAQKLYMPFGSAGVIFQYFISGLQQGTNYGRNELTWPVSTSPRGGASMFMRAIYSDLGLATTIVYNGTSYSQNEYPLVAFASCSTVSPSDQALFAAAAPCRYNTLAAFDANLILKNSKFVLEIPVGWSSSPAIDELVSATVNTGGSATILLAKAIEARHTGGEVIGLTSGNDDVDACLWDALRGAVHTFSRIIEPVIPYTAAAVCSPGGPAAVTACAGAGKLINQKLFDLTRDKTNRQSYALGEAKRALNKDGREIMKHREDSPILYGQHLNQGQGEAPVLITQVQKPKSRQQQKKNAPAKIAKAEKKLRKAEKKLVKASKAAK